MNYSFDNSFLKRTRKIYILFSLFLFFFLFSFDFVSTFNFEKGAGSEIKSVITTYVYSNYSANSSNFWDDLDTPADILGSTINNDLGWITSATDTNVSSICGDNEVLLGQDEKTCVNLNDTIDDRAGTSGMSSADVNTTINVYLGNANDSYLTTYNSTYESFQTFNQTSLLSNLTSTDCGAGYLVIGVEENGSVKCVADTGSTTMTNYSNFSNYTYYWDENLSSTNRTQFTSVSGVFSLLETWLKDFIASVGVALGFNSTYNATYHSYADNVSKNWTEIVFDTYNSTWDDIGGVDTTCDDGSCGNVFYWANATLINESINIYLTRANSSYLSTYNSTYDSYATNVSTNWTKVTFDTYNTTWDDISGTSENVNASINIYLSRANESYLTTYNASYESFNTTVNIQQLYNYTSSLIANFSINDYLNKTINIYFSGSNASFSSDINFSINDYLNKTINYYLSSANGSYLSTYNATYHSYATNVSTNWTEVVFNTYNTTWDDVSGTSEDVNASINIYLERANESYLTTYNATYHSYADNVSKNWTEIVFDTYNTTWDDAGTSDGNGSYDNIMLTNQTNNLNTTQFEFSNGLLNLLESWLKTFLNNIGLINNASYLSTYNSTYHSFTTNVSTNWTEVVFNTYNTTWDDVGGTSEDVNASINIYLERANESYLTTYNATYHSFTTNVSTNWTEVVFGTYNSTWDDSGTSEDVNASIVQYQIGGNESWLTTYNATYEGYLTFNQTSLIGNLTSTDCENGYLVIGVETNGSVKCVADTGGSSLSNYSNFSNYTYYWDMNLSSTNRTQFTSISGVFSLLESWLKEFIASVGVTLGFNSTYNATYESYAENVSTNWTEVVFNTYNTTWDDVGGTSEDVNASINIYLERANESYLTTYNATYHSYATNVSTNWTEVVFGTYNSTWDDSGTSENVNASINIYLDRANASYLTTFNATYHSYATNVSTNWTEVVFNTYNTTWDDVSGTSENVNASINIYLERANASYLDTSNASYESFNTTVNIQQLYNLTASYIANFSINDFLNKTINIYFTGSNASFSADINFSINDFLNKTINYYLSNANDSYLSTYNATYHSFIDNVSTNWTEIVFNTYNTTWDDIGGTSENVNASINIYLERANESYLTTYNATYHNYNTFNASSLLTNLTQTDCDAGYLVIGVENNGSVKCVADEGGGSLSNYSNFSNYTYYWDQNLSSTNRTQFTSIGGIFTILESWLYSFLTNIGLINNASYLSTYNATYHSYSDNVSINWTEVVFDTYNTTWDDTGGASENVNASINIYLSRANESYLTTYNSTYHDYPSAWNTSINQYLTNANASYLTTFNASYHSFNSTGNIQSLINNTNAKFTSVNITGGASQGNMSYNGTCWIMKGATSTMQIC